MVASHVIYQRGVTVRADNFYWRNKLREEMTSNYRLNINRAETKRAYVD